jgi:micrococcal nuclease
MRRPALSLALLSALVLALAVGRTSSAAISGSFAYRGTVTSVVDGDTIDVRLESGKRERIRLIGIDAPELGRCFSAEASGRARGLALGKRVVLRGDATQATRDRHGRLLAYVWLPGGRDLGYQLIAGGFARVYVYRNAFERLSAYRKAEAGAKRGSVGQWRACGPAVLPVSPAPPPPAGGNCHASYTPCLPIVGDLDCADVRALGKAPVRVVGSDPYRLDGDGDGWGCE